MRVGWWTAVRTVLACGAAVTGRDPTLGGLAGADGPGASLPPLVQGVCSQRLLWSLVVAWSPTLPWALRGIFVG